MRRVPILLPVSLGQIIIQDPKIIIFIFMSIFTFYFYFIFMSIFSGLFIIAHFVFYLTTYDHYFPCHDILHVLMPKK